MQTNSNIAPVFLCVAYVTVASFAIGIYTSMPQALMLVGSTASLTLACSAAYLVLIRNHYVLEFIRTRRSGNDSQEWKDGYSRRMMQFTEKERIKIARSIFLHLHFPPSDAETQARQLVEHSREMPTPSGQAAALVDRLIESALRPR